MCTCNTNISHAMEEMEGLELHSFQVVVTEFILVSYREEGWISALWQLYMERENPVNKCKEFRFRGSFLKVRKF